MSLASVAIDDTIIERYKLQAEFSPGRSSVVHTTVIHRSSPVSGARRAVEVRTPWRETRELGSGGFGVVSLQRTADGQCRAVKRVLRRGGVGARTELILMALSMVLDHTDSFVKFLGWFEDRHNLYIATEFIMYGDLSQYIKDPAMKHNARYITMQLLEGVRSLHMNNICHRDLKPQNILMASVIPVRVKIADFGCSKYHEGTELRTNVGTRCYMAPELQGLGKARRKYTNAIDMWALGCVIYEMLTSTPLFSQVSTMSTEDTTPITTISGIIIDEKLAETKEPIFNFNLLWMFCRGDVSSHIEKLEQAQVSGKAVELIESLLRVAPEERLTAASALKSPWIIEEHGPNPDLTILASHTEDPLLQVLLPACEISEAKRGKEHIPQLQMEDSSPDDLSRAVLDGDVRKLSTLLALGSDVEQINDSGETALSAAVRTGKLSSVEILVSHGANLKANLKDGKPVLQLAIEEGNIHIVTLLLDHGACMEEGNMDKSTALIVAASKRDMGMVTLLLGRGANPEAKQRDGETALLVAAREGDKGITKLLLDRGAYLEARSNDGSTALILASSSGGTETVKVLLDRGAYINVRQEQGVSPLHCAIRSNDIATVDLLLSRGADLEAQTAENTTPLHRASGAGHVDIMEALLRAGANTEAVQRQRLTCLGVAVDNNQLAAVMHLLRWGAKMEDERRGVIKPFLKAASRGYLEILMALVKHGAGLEQVNIGGATALHIAAAYGWSKIVKVLLSLKVSIESRTTQGASALHLAAMSGQAEIISILVGSGAALEPMLGKQGTALALSTSNGHIKAVERLLSLGADPHSLCGNGNTILHHAARKGHTAIVKLLLDGGAMVDSRTKDGETPLALASYHGYPDIVSLLIRRGASMDVRIYEQSTPLILAARSGHPEVVSILLAHGAEINAREKCGGSAILIAALEGHLDVIRTLLDHGGAELEFEFEDEHGLPRLNKTAFLGAAAKGHVEVMALLFERGANSMFKDRQGSSALIIAVQSRHTRAVDWLLSIRAAVSQSDNRGNIALIASCKSHTDTVNHLLDTESDIDRKGNPARDTARMSAAAGDRTETVAHLGVMRQGGPIQVQRTPEYSTNPHPPGEREVPYPRRISLFHKTRPKRKGWVDSS